MVARTLSLKETVDHFQSGDFDPLLLLLLHSRADSEPRTGLIRMGGSSASIVSIEGNPGVGNALANATPEHGPSKFVAGVREALMNAGRMPAKQETHPLREVFLASTEEMKLELKRDQQ
jgi:hypothetical protein